MLCFMVLLSIAFELQAQISSLVTVDWSMMFLSIAFEFHASVFFCSDIGMIHDTHMLVAAGKTYALANLTVIIFVGAVP